MDKAAEKKMMEWELGLPSLDEIIPLSQCMIPPQMALAFNIEPEPCGTMADVHQASLDTLASLQSLDTIMGDGETSEKKCDETSEKKSDDQMGPCGEEEDGEDGSGSSSKLQAAAGKAASAGKRRLVWTPQLHKRFIDVVAHLGLKKAVPKTIVHLMNVEGLTRENVASHLQKYRLYMKRKQEPSSFDHLFPFKPVPQSLLESSEQSNQQVNRTRVKLPLLAAKPLPQNPPEFRTKHVMLPPPFQPGPPPFQPGPQCPPEFTTKHVIFPPPPHPGLPNLPESRTKQLMLPPPFQPSPPFPPGPQSLPESRTTHFMLPPSFQPAPFQAGPSQPGPQSLPESSTNHVMFPPPSQPGPPMMSMMGLGHGPGQMGMPPLVVGPSYQGFESYQYSVISNKDWSLEKFTTSHHHHVASNEK